MPRKRLPNYYGVIYQIMPKIMEGIACPQLTKKQKAEGMRQSGHYLEAWLEDIRHGYVEVTPANLPENDITRYGRMRFACQQSTAHLAEVFNGRIGELPPKSEGEEELNVLMSRDLYRILALYYAAASMNMRNTMFHRSDVFEPFDLQGLGRWSSRAAEMEMIRESTPIRLSAMMERRPPLSPPPGRHLRLVSG